MKDHKDGFGLAAFLLLSGVLAWLQARGVIPPRRNSTSDRPRDHAITTLENMPPGRRGGRRPEGTGGADGPAGWNQAFQKARRGSGIILSRLACEACAG